MATADDIANEAQSAYNDAKNLADGALNGTNSALIQASNAANGITTFAVVAQGQPSNVQVQNSNLVIPSYIPTSDFSNDVKQAFDEKFGQLNQSVIPHIQSYLQTFFPDINAAIKDSSDSWIVDTILNGDYVPAEIEDALYNRARDREVKEAQRNELSIIEANAARGFSTPTGIVTFNIAANQQELSKTLVGINREIALKAFDVADANTKFAIQQAVGLRTSFVSALGNFINTALQQQNQAIDYAKTILAAKTSLHDAALNLFNAKISEEKLRTTVGFENKDQDYKSGSLFVDSVAKLNDAELRKAGIKANTAMAAAETLGRVAAGALATRNSMISVAANV